MVSELPSNRRSAEAEARRYFRLDESANLVLPVDMTEPYTNVSQPEPVQIAHGVGNGIHEYILGDSLKMLHSPVIVIF